jgi:excisionase family DNA binding protein
METITIPAADFTRLLDKIETIGRKLDKPTPTNPLTELWLDIQETCTLLKISKRTLQSYRDNGILPFSQIGGKIYFRAQDIEEHLRSHYNKAFNKR